MGDNEVKKMTNGGSDNNWRVSWSIEVYDIILNLQQAETGGKVKEQELFPRSNG